MKINTLLEYTSPSSQPNQSGGQAPEFGRDPNVLETTTGSGSVATVNNPVGGMQRRNSKGSMFQGIKTSKKFVNSPVTEDEISEEQLLTKLLRKELFKRAKDRDIGNRPKDHDIMAKESDPEYNDEAGMATTNLHTALRAVEGLNKVIGPNENLPEWVQEKIAIANDYLVTCWDYMISQQEQGRKYEVDEASSDKYFIPGGGASFGSREREDDEYHVPDPVDPNTLPYNVKVSGQVINARPLPGRQAAIQWAKEKVNAGEIDPKLTTIAPVPKMSEVAPPGAKAERMVKHIKNSYSKDGKITPKEKSIAYATAWKAHNNGSVEEQGVAEGSFKQTPGQQQYGALHSQLQSLANSGQINTPDGKQKAEKMIDTIQQLVDTDPSCAGSTVPSKKIWLSEQGVAEGGAKDRQWSNKDMERLRVATRDFDDIMASDGPEATKQNLIKKRIQKKPMAGPKGVLPEQGVAEGSMYGDEEVSWEKGGTRAPTGAFRNPAVKKVVFSGTGNDGGKYEVIQSGPDDYMIHANGKHVDTYSSLQRAMSVLQNEVSGLTKTVDEESKGLWANIHAKRERIKNGSGERMRKPGSKGAPTKDALRKSAK